MRFQNQCIECSKRQGVRIYHLSIQNQGIASNQDRENRLQRELDERIDNADACLSPAELSLIAIRTGEKHAQSGDPFREVKRTNNEMALSLYPELKKRLSESTDSLHLACQLAACGNIIDLGVHDHFDIHAAMENVLRNGFRRDDYRAFKEECSRLHEEKDSPFLLYLCDNAGEIVFDRLLIEELLRLYPRFRIVAVVRRLPVLNDATMEDARTTGLADIVSVIDNGESELGTVWEKMGDRLQRFFSEADLIVSKGQANYETLHGRPENIYFILKAKCEVIAESLGVELWDAVMARSGASAL
ncbi:MAG: DUF89 family protein [Candidatus Omnitrophica bacterium]|nr:DUF89 family protein [Candidatus Omnitrophota bacterium]